MRLSDTLNGIDYTLLRGDLEKEISGIYYDSRRLTPGSLFVCVSGLKTDGHLYINEAIKNGATAILAERKVETDETITFVLTNDSRKAMPFLAANFYKEPSRDMRVIGVTGTNGKTTTAHLLRAILEEADRKTGIMGTLYAKIDENEKILGHTTPEAFEIEEFMSMSREKDGEYIVMEVSSHALDLNRVDRIYFDAAIFTNLSQDHLDYHKDINNYKNAKLKLFRMLPEKPAAFSIINADDAFAADFLEAAGKNSFTYGISNDADFQARDVNVSLKGSSFTVKHAAGEFSVKMKLVGLFSVYNALAAISFALKEGIDQPIIKSALEKVQGVPGRFEQVDCGQDFTVIVDYAHTPDGLENILKTARDIVENRLITVFGCGGDRDRMKRPLMGEAAARYSDFCVVTSDNPRSEEPEAIIEDIIPGLNKVENSRYAIIADRREAIRHAIYLGRKGDLIVIAGKGHENYQLIGGQILDFDDRKVAREFIEDKLQSSL